MKCKIFLIRFQRFASGTQPTLLGKPNFVTLADDIYNLVLSYNCLFWPKNPHADSIQSSSIMLLNLNHSTYLTITTLWHTLESL